MRQREQAAEMRRALPTGALINQDYIFQEGPADLAGDKPIREVRLSQLFTVPQALPRYVPFHVRQRSNETMSNVHDVDRRI